MAIFLSWNCRGLRNKLKEIKQIISDYHPVCIALQETLMNSSSTCNIRHYHYVKKTHDNYDRVLGGVGLLISNDYPSNTLALNTRIQAVATQIYTDRLITVCTVYLPPNDPINQQQLENPEMPTRKKTSQ